MSLVQLWTLYIQGKSASGKDEQGILKKPKTQNTKKCKSTGAKITSNEARLTTSYN